jgi:hypothetical protein
MVVLVSSYLSPWGLLIPILFAVLCLWAAFWLIRLAVRYGVQDALRQHRQLTQAARAHEDDQSGGMH